MGHYFRSQDMSLVQVILPSDSVFSAVGELGELGLVQFRDQNPDVNPFQRNFVKEVRMCDEMERRLRVFVKHMGYFGIEEDELLTKFCENNHQVPMVNEIDELNEQLARLESEVLEMADNQTELQNNFLELTELRYILNETRKWVLYFLFVLESSHCNAYYVCMYISTCMMYNWIETLPLS